MRLTFLVLFVLCTLACGGAPTSPSNVSSNETALTLRFLHEEAPGAAQDVLVGGSLKIENSGRAIYDAALEPFSGWTVPRTFIVPRNAHLSLVVTYPAWVALHLGPQPAGVATIAFTTATAAQFYYVMVPIAGLTPYVGEEIPVPQRP